MTVSRFNRRGKTVNRDEGYVDAHLRDRDLKQLTHYTTGKLFYPTVDEITRMEVVSVTWSHGDRLYKLAAEHYGDASYWWVIAFFNKVAMDSDLQIGDRVNIPKPIDRVLRAYGV
jgi:nucleoid-associated protein YgaU